jgi:hypothetical protein
LKQRDDMSMNTNRTNPSAPTATLASPRAMISGNFSSSSPTVSLLTDDELFFTLWEKEREIATLRRRLEELEAFIREAKRGREEAFAQWKQNVILYH